MNYLYLIHSFLKINFFAKEIHMYKRLTVEKKLNFEWHTQVDWKRLKIIIEK
jgi:hypothetical protein